MKGSIRRALAAAFVCVPVAGASAQSEILVSDTASKVVRYQYPSGLPLDHFVGAGLTSLNDCRQMVLGPDGKLYVASRQNDSVLRYEGGTGYFVDVFVTSGFGGLSRPEGMTFGPDGMLYVSSRSNHRIIRYDPQTGAAELFASGGGLNRPKGLAFGPDGHLYVASSNNDSVLRYDGQTGDFIGEVLTGSGPVPFSNPRGLLFDCDGYMYIASAGTNSIIRMDVTTMAVETFVASASGGLNFPQYMAFHPTPCDPNRKLLVVMSGGNGRVLRYLGTGSNAGAFDGVVIESNSGGLGNNPMAVLVLPDACDADYNRDGVVDSGDLFDFLTDWSAGCP